MLSFSCIVGSPLLSVLYGSTSFSRELWVSQKNYLNLLWFFVVVTKFECWMYILLVRCDLSVPVKVSLWTSSLSAIWILGLPIPGLGRQMYFLDHRGPISLGDKECQHIWYQIFVCRNFAQVLYISWCHED